MKILNFFNRIYNFVDHVSIFECNDGQKVNKSLRCNRKKDCQDGSDEFDCGM